MPRRKKYPKLPNGYGSIKKLSGKRRNPYGVYPPATEMIAPGQYAPVKAICYVDDYMKGFAVLTAWHAGTYYPGFERTLNKFESSATDTILKDYLQASRIKKNAEKKATFAEIYEEFYKDKYEDSKKSYSQASKNSTRAAFKNCSELHDKAFADLRYNDLQNILDNCPKKHSSLELILSLFHQMYAYAEKFELCEKDYSVHVRIKKSEDDEHGIPFSEDELAVLWQHKADSVVEFILIMCYSGYRIKAYETIEINLKEKYFKGGVKTDAGKKRFVPIHSGIYKLVEHRIKNQGKLLDITPNTFRQKMYETLEQIGLPKHTPHDTRHTFSMLCEKYHVNENDRKRMLGHAFSDITNKVYGHRTLEELREEIEKIKILL
ncbi:MAG: integrase [Ruminococcus sp.]|nr:integrase [Ruminococcus sp.]